MSSLVSNLYDTDEESNDSTSQSIQKSPAEPDHKSATGHDDKPAFTIDRKSDEYKCAICSSSEFRYKCPSCLLRTCSLACFKTHKANLKCTGLRYSLQFKRLANFDDSQLKDDFQFLDNYNRQIDGIKRQKRNIVQSLTDLPNWLMKLKFEANRRFIKLKILPAGFKRRLQNKSTFMYSSKEIHWDVELVFPDLNLKRSENSNAKRITFHVHRVPEKRKLKDLLDVYLKPQSLIDNQALNSALKFYHAADEHEIAVLIKLSFELYVKLDQRMSIGDCLKGKSIIEYPTLLVVLARNLAKYKLVGEKELKGRLQEYADKSYGLLIKNGVVRRNDDNRSRRGNELRNGGGDSNVDGVSSVDRKVEGSMEESKEEVKELGIDSNEMDLNENDKSADENQSDEESEQSEDDGPPEEVQTRYVFDNSYDNHQDDLN